MKNDSVKSPNLIKRFGSSKNSKYNLSTFTRYFTERLEWLLSVTRGQGEVD